MNFPCPSLPRWDSELLVWSAATRGELLARLQAVDLECADLSQLVEALADASAVPGTHRYALVASTPEELRRAVDYACKQLARDDARPFTLANSAYYGVGEHQGAVAVLFPGFGAQPGTLSADLRTLFPCVQRRMAAQGDVPSVAAGDPLGDALNALLLNDLSLWALFSELGLRPAALLGHSYGENAVLYASGMVDDLAAVFDIARRVARSNPPQGNNRTAMLAVSAASREVLDPLLDAPSPEVFVALDNCPQQTVVWGGSEILSQLRAHIVARGEMAFDLPGLTLPAHTPAFPLSRDALAAIYANVAISTPRLASWSCASAERFPDTPAAIRELLVYQWHHPVRFQETVRKLAGEGVRTFVELGAADFLSGFVRDTLRGSDCAAVATNREGRPTLRQLQLAVAQLVARGCPLDLRRFHEGAAALRGVAPALSSAPQSAASAAPCRMLEERVELVLAEMRPLLRLAADAPLDASCGFFDLGMNSLGCVSLIDTLARRLHLSLPQTLPFDYPTPLRLAQAIEQMIGGEAADVAAPIRPLSAAERQPVAIIGAGCRLPGGISSLEDFWQALMEGRDTVGRVPPERWNVDVVAPNDKPLNRLRAGFGAFLNDIKGFDAEFFGISPREAESLDPQQRLLLELCWEALENACIDPAALDGSPAGVFVGIAASDYAQRLSPRQRLDLGGYMGSGNAASTAAGRISFSFGLNGPCLAIDTACSSSLAAIHLACRSLRSGESSLALAGGVNLLINGEASITLARAQALSATGRCRTFDAQADGYVRAEGGAMVVLKRLDDALADGDNVLAVIHGSALNHDGRSSGLTAPNGLAQQAVIRQALADARLNPAEVGVIEAHGTGTALGDPIEVQALAAVYGPGRSQQVPLWIGSVKSNLGHLESAAGVTGLLKACLQLHHLRLAASLHVTQPNPRIDWPHLPLRIVTASRPWDEAIPPVAGVSAFGISGSNVHLLVGAAAPAASCSAGQEERSRHVLTLSAKTPAALDALCVAVKAYLIAHPDCNFPALCRASNLGRSHFRYRRAVSAADAADAAAQLECAVAPASPGGPPRVALLFTGQGAQYPRMGRQLYDSEPVFRAALDHCARLLQPYLPSPLLDVLFSDNPVLLGQTRWTQPCLFAFEYALAQLWLAWGIKPAALLGHSIGEYVAALLAGVFDLDDALRLVARRGELIQSLPADGGMLAVAAAESALPALLGALYPRLSLAAVNAPQSVVVSGRLSDLDAAAIALKNQDVRCVRLEVSHAFHSSLLEPILDDFRAAAAGIQYRQPTLPLLSNLSGDWTDPGIATPDYWRAHVRAAVRFGPALQRLLEKPVTCLEIGPKPFLCGLGGQLPEAARARWIPSIVAPGEEVAGVFAALAALYEAGCCIDWHAFHQGRPATRAAFPGYCFQRVNLWLDVPAANGNAGDVATGSGMASLLAPQPIPGDPRGHFSTRVGLANTHALGGLRRNGADLLLTSAPLTLALAALSGTALAVGSLEAADFPAQGLFHVTLDTLNPPFLGEVHHFHESDGSWTPLVRFRPIPAQEIEEGLAVPLEQDGSPVDTTRFYDAIRNLGYEYAERHRQLDRLVVGPCHATAEIDAVTRRFVSAADMAALVEFGFQLFAAIQMQAAAPARLILRRLHYAELRPVPVAILQLTAILETLPDGTCRGALRIVAADGGATVLALDGLELEARPLDAAVSVSNVVASVAEKSPEEQRAYVLKFLHQAIAAILHSDDPERIDPTQTLIRMGMDSLLALQLSIIVQRGFAVTVSVGFLIDQCTLDKLADFILAALAPAPGKSAAPALDYVDGEL